MLGWKDWKKSLQSLRAELQSLRAELIAVCMQRWSFRRRSLSWETSFDWSEMKVRALPGVSPHPAVRSWPGFQIKWTQPDFSWFFMRTIPAAGNRGGMGWQSILHLWQSRLLPWRRLYVSLPWCCWLDWTAHSDGHRLFRSVHVIFWEVLFRYVCGVTQLCRHAWSKRFLHKQGVCFHVMHSFEMELIFAEVHMFFFTKLCFLAM